MKALTLTILEKNGLEFCSEFFFKSLSIFSPKNKSFYEVKPVPNESPVTLLATHAKKFGVHYQKFQKINPNVKKCHFFTVMKWNIIAIYVVKLKSVLHSRFLINLDKIWYVQVYPQGTSAHQILSRSVQKQKSFFLCSTFTVKMTLVKWGLKNEPIRGWRMQFLS